MITLSKTPKPARFLGLRCLKVIQFSRSLAQVAQHKFEAPLSRFEKAQFVNYSDFIDKVEAVRRTLVYPFLWR